MSAKLSKDLLAAHMNALNKTLESVEIQVAAVKTVLKLAKVGKTADADEEEEDQDEALPAKKTKKGKKAAQEEEDEDDDSDSDDDDSSDEEDSDSDEDAGDDSEEDEEGDDDEDDDAPPAGKKGSAVKKPQVIKALQAFAKANDRKAALKLLKKVGVSSIHDLDPKKYPKLMELLDA